MPESYMMLPEKYFPEFWGGQMPPCSPSPTPMRSVCQRVQVRGRSVFYTKFYIIFNAQMSTEANEKKRQINDCLRRSSIIVRFTKT